MTDRLPDEIHYPGPASEFIKALAYESFGILLKERIAEFNDDAATKVLSKLDEFVELIKKADQCYNEILSLIVDDELRIIDQMGYSYKKTPDGTIKFSSATDVSNSSEESDKALLTEADYYKVLNQLSEEFHVFFQNYKKKNTKHTNSYDKSISLLYKCDLLEYEFFFVSLKANS